jgi:hypothetical protein
MMWEVRPRCQQVNPGRPSWYQWPALPPRRLRVGGAFWAEDCLKMPKKSWNGGNVKFNVKKPVVDTRWRNNRKGSRAKVGLQATETHPILYTTTTEVEDASISDVDGCVMEDAWPEAGGSSGGCWPWGGRQCVQYLVSQGLSILTMWIES